MVLLLLVLQQFQHILSYQCTKLVELYFTGLLPIIELFFFTFAGVLPFGNTNSYASELFPKKELEVQRFCEASMAIVKNK